VIGLEVAVGELYVSSKMERALTNTNACWKKRLLSFYDHALGAAKSSIQQVEVTFTFILEIQRGLGTFHPGKSLYSLGQIEGIARLHPTTSFRRRRRPMPSSEFERSTKAEPAGWRK